MYTSLYDHPLSPENTEIDFVQDQDELVDDDGNIINDTDSEISEDDVIMDQDGEIIGYLNQE